MTKTKIVSAALSATTALLAIAPITLASTVEVSGNGEGSGNTVNLEINRTVQIQQTNTAAVRNTVDANANTGSNEANDNTGGAVAIKTGDATTKVALSTQANSNTESGACCEAQGVNVKVSGNGSGSDNDVNLSLNNERNISTVNELNIDNRIEVGANTGDNEANGNTGGDVNISTGDALIQIVLTNKGNSNVVNCNCGANVPGGEELPPLPGTVAAIPAAAAPVGKTLPLTGFDYQLILIGSALVTSAGAVLKKGSRKLEDLIG